MNRNAKEEGPREWVPDEGEWVLEGELRELRPWGPSPALRQRIAEEAARMGRGEGGPEEGLSGEVRRFPGARPVWMAAAAAVALVAVVAAPFWVPPKEGTVSLATRGGVTGPSMDGGGSTGENGVLGTVRDGERDEEKLAGWEKEEILLGGHTDGVVELEEGPPMWRVRYQLLHRAAWTDEATGTMREQFMPEERVLFVPVRHQ